MNYYPFQYYYLYLTKNLWIKNNANNNEMLHLLILILNHKARNVEYLELIEHKLFN